MSLFPLYPAPLCIPDRLVRRLPEALPPIPLREVNFMRKMNLQFGLGTVLNLIAVNIFIFLADIDYNSVIILLPLIVSFFYYAQLYDLCIFRRMIR